MNIRDAYCTNPDYTEYKTDVKGIQLFYDKVMLRGVCFNGRRTKPTWTQSFTTLEALMLTIDRYVKQMYNKNAEKDKAKQAKAKIAKKNRANVKVGDIFYTSWGYDCTITTFHQVVEKPSPARVLIREIGAERVSGDWMSGTVKPIRDNFIADAKKSGVDCYGHLTSADEFKHTAYKADETKSYYTSSD